MSFFSQNNVVSIKRWLFHSRYVNRLGDTVLEPGLSELGITASIDDKKALDKLIQKSSDQFKDDKTTSVVKVKDFIIKRYNARSAYHHFSRSVRKSRAQRCWSMSDDFAQAGLNIAKPFLMHEQRFGPLRLDAYFISEALSGQELLSALPAMSDEQKQSVVAQLTQAFEKMRIAKISHGDMKATNLMWVDERLFFIDLDGAKKHFSQTSWQRAHKKDVKRFLKNWRDQPELLNLFNDLEEQS